MKTQQLRQIIREEIIEIYKSHGYKKSVKEAVKLFENFDLSNDKWRNWAINKNVGLTYDDLSGYERNFVDKISDYINKYFGSAFDKANREAFPNQIPAGFDKQRLTIIGLDYKTIVDISDYLEREFGEDKFLTLDASGIHFGKIENIYPSHYRLYLNPLYIEKFEKEAIKFYDKLKI